MKQYWGIAFGIIFLSVFTFFSPVLLSGKLPIPADTIIGLYHPFRDLYANEYPNGIPYKNFLITDPVRQQYPWRSLVVQNFKKLQLPIWNPYNFSGTPLLANIQSAPFYPLNILFFVLPFATSWSLLIMLQPFLAALFLFLYLRSLKISVPASLLGGASFAFSGFFIAWLEWGTILHTALWTPLLLYSVDKIVKREKQNDVWIYSFIALISLCFSFFAGHLQTFFYVILLLIAYIFARAYQQKKIVVFLPLVLVGIGFLLLTFIQWYPTALLILQSARDTDQADWTRVGWFIPWQHSIQFLVPDFFGNPATLNYWSDWNYAEFVGYIGIMPLIMAIFSIFFRRDKKTLFFSVVLMISLIFAFPTPIAKIPFIVSLPFISTAQPTRLLFLIDFSLAILAAFGLDYYIKHTKKITFSLAGIFLCFALLWIFIFIGHILLPKVTAENLLIAKRNLIFPTILFALATVLCVTPLFIKKQGVIVILPFVIIAFTLFDLLRFGIKFTPFTQQSYLFPSARSIEFLQKQKGPFRIMTTDSRILPPNFSSIYHIQSVDGYDPIYLRSYAELIAASERGKPDISPPFGFNRIITPHKYGSKIIDLLNVTYILSLSDIKNEKLTKVFQEGETRIYKNNDVIPRAFFVSKVIRKTNKNEVIQEMFNTKNDMSTTAITDDKTFNESTPTYSSGKAEVNRYDDNAIVIKTENTGKGFLVVSDVYYPLWEVFIDGKKTVIFKTDLALRGVLVPPGRHTIIFSANLF